jgi:hypothetical protein
MSAGGPNPGENIAAESSEPGKESGGGLSTTEESPHSEASGDMPVPNCPTCISGGGGQDLHRISGRGQREAYLPESACFRGTGSIGSTSPKGGDGPPVAVLPQSPREVL